MFITKQYWNNNSGFVIGTLLLYIFLFGAIVTAITLSGRSYTQSIGIDLCVSKVVAQANLIRTKVSKCVIDYPSGNNGTGFHLPYPGASSLVNASTLTCPGSSANLWTSGDAILLPATPIGFDAWGYINDATSVRISIQSSDISYGTCMSKALGKFGADEATLVGDTLTIQIVK